MSKSSKVCSDGSFVVFGEEGFSDLDNITDSITKINDELPFFLAALGFF